jgi:peptidoglycan DL-endopeptidase CwlO
VTPIRIRQLTPQAMGEATHVSSSVSLGRHRAAPVRNNPLVEISQAVSSNAGSVGRQAAVIAAASGLVLSVGMPAQAETANREANAVTAVTAAQAKAVEVSVPADVKLRFDRASVRSTAAPAVETAAPVRADEATAPANESAEVAAAPEAPSETAAVEPEPAAAAAPEEAAAPAPEPKPEPAAASAGNSSVAAAAYAGIGNPYVFGGTSPTAGWDCSGFVQWAYAQAGKNIPRTNQWSAMTPTSNPKPGDLVVQNGGSHVGIYVGNGQMISAMNPSDGTQLHSVSAMSVSGFYTLP